ncbi:MAG: hypothetical protein KIS73_03320 [Enhydrobacter sp.]|nr:hypothetical protein [Enhydrobacter sp.]
MTVTIVGSPTEYDTIQDAIAAAVEFDTIVVGAGDYSGVVTVNKTLTILGANSGVAWDGARGAESTLAGGFHITASGVTIDGMEIEEGGVMYAGMRAGVFLDGARSNVSVLNSIIDQGLTPHPEGSQHGIITTYAAVTANMTVSGNSFANWNQGMYLNPGVDDSTISNNSFGDNGNHIVVDDPHGLTIAGNDFGASGGSKIAVGAMDNPTNLEEELDLAGNTFNPDTARLSIFPYGGEGQHIVGTDGADNFRGDYASPPGNQTYEGLDGDDKYFVDSGDSVVEAEDEGSDTVITSDSYILGDNVENLTLLDLGTDTQTFDDMTTGPIANGENGWKDVGPADDQAIVEVEGNQVWRISSDPASGDFGGPYTPALSVTAGEPQTSADGDFHSIKFRVKPVSETPDDSRIEVDFANAAGTDRNNFMVIESTGAGIRIAVNEPKLDGNWTNNTFTAFTGNVELASGVDPTSWHDIELRLTYVDGADNDVIQVYLDGALIGTTTTFENYRDAIGGTHSDNAEANQTSRIIFRGSNAGQPVDGAGGQNQGFYFDDVTSTVANNASGTGNALNNVISGNSGDNELSGLAGDDTIAGADGNDTIEGGEGTDTLSGDAGDDVFVETIGEGVDTIDGGSGTDTLQLVGTNGDDTFTANVSGGNLTNPGETLTSVENIELDLGGGSADTLSYDGTTEGVTVNLATGEATGFTSIADVENVTGGSDDDSLTGDSGDNVLTGGGGNDSLAGGDGTDVAHYDGAATITYDGGWSVTAAGEGTDNLSGIEQVDAAGGKVLLVGNGGYETIQEAIDASVGGETIMISAGTYAGNVNINKSVTLVGVGDAEDVIIQGTFKSANGITGSVADFMRSAAAYASTGGTGLTVSADNVTIENLTITSFVSGIDLGNGVDHTTIEGVIVDGTVNGIRKGNSAEVTDLAVIGGEIRDGVHGVYFAREEVGTGKNITNVTFDGTHFENLIAKGIYAETLDGTTLFDNLTMDDVGQFGRGDAFGNPGEFGNGIDINLKFGVYTGSVVIQDFEFTNTGNSTGADPTGHFGGAAIAVKARNDSNHPTYGPNPADASGLSVLIQNGSIDGTSTGVRLGEPGKSDPAFNTTGPDVTVTNVTIENNLENAKHNDFDNVSQSTLTVNGTEDGDTYTAVNSPTSTGDIVYNGLGGNDVLTSAGGNDTLNGGDGDDTLDGGSGTDTATYTSNVTVEATGSGWTVDGGSEGTDTLSNVEIVEGSDSQVLLVGNGGFATIQEAIDAAEDGDTVLISTGTYNEALSINGKAITLEEAAGETVVLQAPTSTNAITLTGDFEGGDVVIKGLEIVGAAAAPNQGMGVYVTEGADVGKLTIDDVSIHGAGSYGVFANGEDKTVGGNPVPDALGEIVITNSAFYNNGYNGANGSAHIKLHGFSGNATIQNVTIDNAPPATPVAQRPDYGIELTGTVNTALSGSNAVVMGTVVIDNVTMTGWLHKNAFAVFNYGNIDGLSIGTGDLDLSTVVSDWGPLLNIDGILDDIDASQYGVLLPGGIISTELQGDKAAQTSTNQTIIGTTSWDRLIGKGGDDHLIAGDGNDELYGHDKGTEAQVGDTGDDWLEGGSGNDFLSGGAGDDILDGGTGNDTMVGGTGDDTYVVDSASDVVTELANEGTDTVESSIDYTLGANLENLTLTGAANLIGTGNASANEIIGNSGANTLDGLAGDDTLSGEGGDDQLFGGADNDALYGGAGLDVLAGSTGNDLLDGGADADSMIGGAGDDTYVVDNAGDTVSESANQGTDTVESEIDYILGANLENLTLLGAANLKGTGNSVANVLTGNTGNNILDGGTDADSMIGGDGNDSYAVDNASDTVTELAGEGTDSVTSSVSHILSAHVENLTLTGSALNATGNAEINVLTGNDLENVLDGKAGADTMIGGKGNDTYYVDNVGDVVDEAGSPGSGTDIVYSEVSYTLAGNVENLTLVGGANLNGTGNNSANTLTGNTGDNVLDGKAGADSMIGGDGNDSYVVDDAGDTVTELAGEGTDSVTSSVSHILSAHVENLTLSGGASINATGNAEINVLTGNTGDNVLDGMAGADTMKGRKGNDTYYVDDAGDVVEESSGADTGTDIVYSSVNYTLTANVENLTLAGAALNATGNAEANVLTGNANNNVLDGQGGADTMVGGDGSDSYVVDDAGDVVTELANEGTDDEVTSSVSYALTANVEDLTLTGTAIDGTGNDLGNTIVGNLQDNNLDGGDGNDHLSGGDGLDILTGGNGDDELEGEAGNDTLLGDSGNDRLDGGAGADVMLGGDNNDTYVVDNAGDVVIEGNNQGTDTVEASVTWTLGSYLENLSLTGSDAINGTGNSLANVITGNAASNTLTGGGGSDTFVFDTVLNSATNVDNVTDFAVASDLFNLSQSVFTEIDLGTLTADEFHIGASATTDDQRIVYDKANGTLLYDADGSGAEAAVEFATVTANTDLTHDHFVVI